METLLAVILFVLLIAFSVWRNRVDISKNGPVPRQIRYRTYVFTLIWLVALLAMFYIYMPVYLGFIALFFLYSQTFGVGGGKHGIFRQLRDSGFIASVASIPICLLIWNYGNA